MVQSRVQSRFQSPCFTPTTGHGCVASPFSANMLNTPMDGHSFCMLAACKRKCIQQWNAVLMSSDGVTVGVLILWSLRLACISSHFLGKAVCRQSDPPMCWCCNTASAADGIGVRQSQTKQITVVFIT